MKSLLVIIGTILIVVAFGIMSIFVITPAVAPTLDDVPPIKAVLQSMLCKGSETITAAYSSYSSPGRYSRNIRMSCVNNENQARDVSGQAILYGVVGYLVPFLIGLFMVIIGAGRRRRFVLTTSNAFMQANDMLQQLGMEKAGFQLTVDSDGNTVVQTPDGQVYTGQQAMMTGSTSATDRLQQLKSLYDAGLITESEYEKKKQEILRQL